MTWRGSFDAEADVGTAGANITHGEAAQPWMKPAAKYDDP
jgi:hypothetical protein